MRFTAPGDRGYTSNFQQMCAFDDLLRAINKSKQIIIIAGAGISVAAGIPDFRSSDGIYSQIRSTHGFAGRPEDMFDINVYSDDKKTAMFHSMINTLHHTAAATSPTAFHRLVARIAREGRLLRFYTQNIDNLDQRLPELRTETPLPDKGPWPHTIQVHGNLETVFCTVCSQIFPYQPENYVGSDLPECSKCAERNHIRTTVEGKRALPIGRLRSRIMLYNDDYPQDDSAIGEVANADYNAEPDCLLVVGTTLKGPGMRRIARDIRSRVRAAHGTVAWINTDDGPNTIPPLFIQDLVVKASSEVVAMNADMRRCDR